MSTAENEMHEYQAGDLVQAEVRTGVYAAEFMERNGPRALVSIKAVLKHPEQGDLHQPYNPDAAMFHERRALSYTEKTNVLLRDLKPYRGELPDYKLSLHAAVEAEKRSLDSLLRWAAKSLELLEQLEKDYR
ncbi:kinase-associated lipoprotein B [Paenibacillus sp. HB172176]|uniref:kinase-associated lipoprotein B n=1 Tax=Paenibacillus sp. HB172176 TaxID=2493690 RepID=UPI001F117FA9|nr:kinase-associated lipoprotein B [Paenibacillus sp. HB172176]